MSSLTILVRRKTFRLAKIPFQFLRGKCDLGRWKEDLTSEIKHSIENHWRPVVAHNADNVNAKTSYYVLSMFPYPSGNLHLGHVRVYSISDTIARFHKLNGKKVIHPMGWDAFGLPAENAAMERQIPPREWTHKNIDSMRKQLDSLAFNFDWEKEVTTCSPDYYKWTQFIFVKLFEHGFAYRTKALVNWDPVDKTVLADEQVDASGYSWRSGAKVEKKLLNQWFVKTTKFAKQLYDGLSDEKLDNWKDIVNLQKHWIGECDGTTITFKLDCDLIDEVVVWTSKLEKFINPTFLTIKSDHILAKLFKTTIKGNRIPVLARNPISDAQIPIFVCDDLEYLEGTDVYIASTECSENDRLLAQKFNLETSNNFNSKLKPDELIQIAKEKSVGGYPVSSKLKDWLISRQRYWGTPIPIIHCDKCGSLPVPYSELPVRLPEIDSLKPGFGLLELDEWVNCKCPKCHGNAKRETDTMDTFVDSTWYFLRYLDPKNNQAPFDTVRVKDYTPVDLYIGGKEHAVLHLYYARFMGYFFNYLGWLPHPEPFKKLLVQGMIMGQSYRVKSSGKYLPAEKVKNTNGQYEEVETGERVEVQWEKMSKSKYNGVNPQSLLDQFGCDTTRLLILADVPPATSRNWSDATFPGVLNWQHRLWLTIREFLQHRNDSDLIQNRSLSKEVFNKYENSLWEARNYFTAATTYNFQYSHQLSIGISRMQALTNSLRNKIPSEVIACSGEFELALASLIIMLAPVAPHFCCELWAGLQSAPNRIHLDTPFINWNTGVLDQKWPKVDSHYQLTLTCKVDGADRGSVKVAAQDFDRLTHERALEMLLNEESVAKRVKRGVARSEFEMYPGCRSTLYIFTNRRKQEKVTASQ